MNEDYVVPVVDDLDSDFKLQEHITQEMEQLEESIAPVPTEVEDTDLSVEEDFQIARTNIKTILSKSDAALNGILLLAQASDHPRAFEVAATMMKTLQDLNKDLVNLHKSKKDALKNQNMQQSADSISNTQNNVVFQGTAAELQKFLRGETQ